MQSALEVIRSNDSQSLLSGNPTAKSFGRRVLVVICAHNEVSSLPGLVQQLRQNEVLVIDDGSTDGTALAAELAGVNVLRQPWRLGKSASLARGIRYAVENNYDTVVEIGADAIPVDGALEHLLAFIESPGVGGVSLVQIPMGTQNLAYRIDELIWSVLAHGKRLQMSKYGYSHLGGVMYAFKPSCVGSIDGSVNDDEQVGECIRLNGFKTVFTDSAGVYFDASSSIAHIMERRQRMYLGHMMFEKSTAPSMDLRIALYALFKSLLEKPSRLVVTIPALVLDTFGRLVAWRDSRSPKAKEKYKRWVTTYAKNSPLPIRNRVSR